MIYRRTVISGTLAGLVAGGFATALAAAARAADCAVPVDRAKFQRYLDLFMGFDRRFMDFYADDVVLSIGARGDLHGPRAIYDYYGKRHEYFTETMELLYFVSDAGAVAVEMNGSYRCIKDVDNPEFFNRAIKAGEIRRHRGMVIYTLEQGKFKTIHGAAPQITSDWRLEA